MRCACVKRRLFQQPIQLTLIINAVFHKQSAAPPSHLAGEQRSSDRVSERKITIDEVEEAAKNGSLKEMFGTGTAAVVSPVGDLQYKDQMIHISDGSRCCSAARRRYSSSGEMFGL